MTRYPLTIHRLTNRWRFHRKTRFPSMRALGVRGSPRKRPASGSF